MGLSAALVSLPLLLGWDGDAFPATYGIIVSDRRLEVPHLSATAKVLNPSLAQWGQHRVLAFRCDDDESDTKPHRSIGLARLNDALEVVGKPQLFAFLNNDQPTSTAEDPRLVVVDEHLYLIFGAMTQNPFGGRRGLNIAEVFLDESSTQTASFRVPHFTQLVFSPKGTPRKYEKNWAPFAFKHAIHLVYEVNPPWIVRVDPEKLAHWPRELAVDEVSHSPRKLTYSFGEMRGGTPALRAPQFEGDYFAFFHGRGSENYGTGRRMYLTIGFYTFAPTPPFAITRLLPFPISLPHMNTQQRPDLECAFPSGVLWHNDKLVVGYGRMDEAIHLLTLDVNELIGHSEIIAP